MLEKEVNTIVLDVDGTLSDEVSWLKITESLGASKELHASLFEDFRRGFISYVEAKAKLVKLWQETGKANRDFMEREYRSWTLKSDAKEIVDYLKGKYQICLISGAIDLYVQIVAGKLGVTDWYANTELIWNDKGNLIDFNYYPDQAQKKLEQLKEYVAKNGLDIKMCAVVGNGDSDVVLFKQLKYGIEVNLVPSPALEKLIHKRVKKLTELKSIF
jgi:HAD superfamily phosphoserine phosphatase-like hydrolase